MAIWFEAARPLAILTSFASGSASWHSPRMNGWGTFEELRFHFFRYYNTQFEVQDPALGAQIGSLLNRDGGVWRDP